MSVIIIGVFASPLFLIDQAHASCNAELDYDLVLKESELAFTGTVTRLDNYDGPQKVTFFVHDVVKGEINTPKFILENSGLIFLENDTVVSSSVNVDYKIGKTYKVYVTNGQTNQCTTKLTSPPSDYMWEPGPEDGNYYADENEESLQKYSGDSKIIEGNPYHGGPPIPSEDYKIFHTPPLKQFKSAIPSEQTQCKEGLSRIIKYDGTPACVMERSIAKLNERNWTNAQNIHYLNQDSVDAHYYYHSYTYSIEPFEIRYTIAGADVYGIFQGIESTSLIVKLDDVISDGKLIISIPRELLDSKVTAGMIDDDVFIVLVNGEEESFDEIKDSGHRALSIMFEEDSEEIVIIGK